MTKTDAKKVATLWTARKAGLETSIKDLFTPFQDTAMNWPAFIREISMSFGNIVDDMEFENVSVKRTKTGWATASGKQIGGHRPGDPLRGRGLNPPEHEEKEFEVPGEAEVETDLVLNFKTLAKNWAVGVRALVAGSFQTKLLDNLIRDDKFRKKFLEVAKTAVQKSLKDTDIDFWDSVADMGTWIRDDSDAPVDAWKGSVKATAVGNPKVSAAAAAFPVSAVLKLKVSVEMPDETDFDPPEGR